MYKKQKKLKRPVIKELVAAVKTFRKTEKKFDLLKQKSDINFKKLYDSCKPLTKTQLQSTINQIQKVAKNNQIKIKNDSTKNL